MKPKKGPCKTCAAWDCPDEIRANPGGSSARCIRRAPTADGFGRTNADNECFEHLPYRKKRAKAK